MKKVLNRDTLKYAAIIGMAMQHAADKFLEPEVLGDATLLYWILYLAGGITAPLMCYFLAGGYWYTHSKTNYALRLLIFAVIAQVPYAFFWEESFIETIQSLNFIFNLFMCFCALTAYEKIGNKILKWIVIAACVVLTHLFFEWGAIPVIWVLFFNIFRDKPKMQLLGFALGGFIDAGSSLIEGIIYQCLDLSYAFLYISYFVMPLLVGIVIYYFYNGKKGRFPVFSKWFFYIFYPLHFLILHLIYLAST